MTIPHDVLIGEANLAFVFNGLDVRYRASAEPQKLRIRSWHEKPIERGNQYDALAWSAEKCGLGGGVEFSPDAVRMTATGGDFASLKKAPITATEFSTEMEVASLSPKYMRVIVERLRPCVRLVIEGDLPPDGSPMSCTTQDVQRWVGSGAKEDQLGLFEPVPFSVEEGELQSGASLRIHFEDPLSAETVDMPAGLAWRTAAVTGRLMFLFDRGETKYAGVSLIPKRSKGKADLAVKWDRWDVTNEPAKALLLNMCTHIHQTVQPVKKVVLKLS
jgi:hypothetical protein